MKLVNEHAIDYLIGKIKQLNAQIVDQCVKLTGDQDVEGTKNFDFIGVRGTIELPFNNKSNGGFFQRFNLDSMPANREVDLFRTHYAGRKFALKASRGASGTPVYKLDGDLTFNNSVSFTGNSAVIKIISENNTSRAQWIEFIKGTTRLGYLGLRSVNNDNLTLESSGDRTLDLIAYNLFLTARNLLKLSGKVQFDTEILMGRGGSTVSITPEDDSRKRIRFHRTNEQGRSNCVFDLDMDNKSKLMNIPTPKSDGDAANKAYVDAKLSGSAAYAKLLTNVPTTADLPAGFIGLKIIT